MRDRLSASRLTAALGCLLLTGLTATGAVAQGMIFDWGGEDKTATSGKGHVKFNGGGRPGDIIVSFGDRKLYFFTAPGEADTYLVATPRDQSRWEGVTSVTQKRENPSWTPTPHMLQENPKLPRWVPGGHPMNPLGIRALYLGSSDYRIHGTDAPWTIGTPVSKGCVRMFNKDVVDLYPRVRVGTKVIVTWQKFDNRTQSMANLPSKGITELAPGEVGKATVASYAPGATGAYPAASPARSKWKRATEDEQVDVSPDKLEEKSAEAPKLAAVSETEDFIAPRERKSIAAADADGVTGEVKERADNSARETSELAKIVAVRPERPARRMKSSVKSDTSSDGDATPVNGGKRGGEQASLDVAERALAAAERAANAAERAAAAAERAVAASQGRSSGSGEASSPANAPAGGDVTAH